MLLAILLSTLILTAPTIAQQGDDCPGVSGDSSEDRIGCPDSDGDGWSDPDDDWTVADGADAFPNEITQWADRDGDGFGDSSSFNARLIDHFPDDEHLHRAVLSVGCAPPDHTLPVGESSHFLCTVKNEALVPVRIIPSWDVDDRVSKGDLPARFDLEQQGFGGDTYEVRLSFKAEQAGVSGGIFYLNESSESQIVYSIPLGILVESSSPTTSSADVSPYFDPVLEQANSVAGWLTTTTGYQFSSQSALAILVAGPLLLLVITRRTASSVNQRRKEQEALEAEAANEEEREAAKANEGEPEEISIEDMAADPNQPEQKPKRGVKGAEGRVLAPGMVEVMVGGIDMPSRPTDEFNVLKMTLDESDLDGDEWGDEEELEDDDDTDFKVARKHRTTQTSEGGEVESEAESEPARKQASEPASGERRPRAKQQRSTKKSTVRSSRSETGKGGQEQKDVASPTTKPSSKSETTRKKKPGKVGHTRGPGVDLK